MRAVLTDLEGTTTALGFVRDTLFPDARARLPSFLAEHGREPEVLALLAETAALAKLPAGDLLGLSAALLGWIDADRKAPPLKALQGKIWAEGYAAGRYRGHLYPDVAPALRRWRAQGLGLYVFSSGSVEAQRLLLGHSVDGDLTVLVGGFFDTRTGAKQDPAAYRAIARETALPPAELRFLSDVPAELAAAEAAGCQVIQLCREGLLADGRYPAVTSFEELP